MQTPRLNLVRLRPDHLHGYHVIWSDPVATRWIPHGVTDVRITPQNLIGENYAVFLRDDIDINILRQSKEYSTKSNSGSNQSIFEPCFLLGVVGIYSPGSIQEVGFIYHRLAWGYGFGTEVLAGYLDIWWKRPQSVIAEAYCDSENVASANVLRKRGFELVGILTGDYEMPWRKPASRDSLRF
ncbi:hypothetical protein N7486_005849 [Penicillium sp. IBT 16267x]|nr:hypothetical protein N7486_005849 [Penicillium sp. IBT 16267x]